MNEKRYTRAEFLRSFVGVVSDHVGSRVRRLGSTVEKAEAASRDLAMKQPLKAYIDRKTCAAFNGTMCRSCLDGCPETAITLESFQFPVVNLDQCTGCGECVPVCIASSITVLGKENQS